MSNQNLPDGNPAKLVGGKLFIKGTAELNKQVAAELNQPDPSRAEAEALLSSDSEHEDTNDNDGDGSSCDNDDGSQQDCP